jgi:hypothetical protein
MRRRTAVAALMVLVAAGGAGVTAAPAAAQAVQPHPGGRALGAAHVGVFVRTYSSSGAYSTNGQLGSGRYAFDAAYSACAGGSVTIAGDATLTRSDGARLRGTLEGVAPCGLVTAAGEQLTLSLTSGSRDLVRATLVFDRFHEAPPVVTPDGTNTNEAFTFTGTVVSTRAIGYWMVRADGGVHAFGGARHRGDTEVAGATDIEPAVDGAGYLVLGADGTIENFGSAGFGGLVEGTLQPGETAVAIEYTPSGEGAFAFTDRGRVKPLGRARSFGDLRAVSLHAPIVDGAVTASGRGYYLVAADGGVFAFGDARFRGSMGGTRLARPVVGMATTANGEGYWLTAADGGVFAFGAPFRGSLGARSLAQPIVGVTRYGGGYLMSAADGGVFNFSGRPFFGSLGGVPLPAAVVGVAATR